MPAGHHSLKGVPNEWELYRLETPHVGNA
jgi:hypothetical protein